MKHRHEIESGRTSTATTHLMGFRSSGEAIAGRDQIRANKRKGEDEIAREAYRVITLMDLAGHEKYLKTTYVRCARWSVFCGILPTPCSFFSFEAVSTACHQALPITRSFS